MLLWLIIIILLFGLGGSRGYGVYNGPPIDVGLVVLIIIVLLLFRGRLF